MAYVSWVNGNTLNASDLTSAFGNSGWTTYTPTLTNLTLGNGSLSCRYMQIGKTVFVQFNMNLGSTSSVGASPKFSLPVTAGTTFQALNPNNGWAKYSATGGFFYGASYMDTTTTAQLMVANTASTYMALNNLSSTVPGTWTTGHYITTVLIYEAA